MTVTLTADHRAVDGAMAAEFLQTLRACSKSRRRCCSDQSRRPIAVST